MQALSGHVIMKTFTLAADGESTRVDESARDLGGASSRPGNPGISLYQYFFGLWVRRSPSPSSPCRPMIGALCQQPVRTFAFGVSIPCLQTHKLEAICTSSYKIAVQFLETFGNIHMIPCLYCCVYKRSLSQCPCSYQGGAK